MSVVSLYVVTNKNNGKQYVGYTTTAVERRWHAHQTSARRGSMLCFHQALRKHGSEAFEWVVVSEHASAAEAKLAEVALIAVTSPRYNMTAGGDGSGPCTEQRRQKMRVAMTGKPKSPQHAANAAAAQIGKLVSASARANQSVAHTGHKDSPETRAKKSAALTGRPVHQETRDKIGRKQLGNTHSLGHKHTEETILKMRRASVIREATKRGEIALWP
jgi:group I intron endonuclease